MAKPLLILGLVALAGCEAGDRGKTETLQASGAAEAPPLNTLDRRFAGEAAPDVAMERADGKAVTLADVRAENPGKRVLVNLWATWCAPCLKEMPELDRLAVDEAGGLVVVPLSQDMEGWQVVNGFFAPGRFKTLVPLLDQPGSFGERLKARGLPVSVLYDADGREVWRVAGVPDWNGAEVRAALRP